VKKILLAAVIAVLSLNAFAELATGVLPLPPGVVRPAYFDAKGIKVLAYVKGVGGLNVWQVERKGIKTVFYSTPDNKVLVSGVLWDASTGDNQSDAYITDAMTAPANVAKIEATPASANVGVAPGGISSQIADVEKLQGVKEGNGSPRKTIYIMYDPRCPHCKNVYDASRDFVRRGGSIKWLPTTVLGDPQDGMNRIALVLQSKDPVAAMGVVERGGQLGRTEVKPETFSVVARNEAYFWGAFHGNPSAGTPSVPVAFFQTKDGAPQMVSDLDDPQLLKRLFEDMSK